MCLDHAPEYSLPMSSRSSFLSLPNLLLVLNQQKKPLLSEESTQRAIDNAIHNLEFHEHFRIILRICFNDASQYHHGWDLAV